MSNHIIVKKDEERTVELLWTGAETELQYEIILAEPGASVRFRGLLIGKQADSLALNITVRHEAPNTSSDVIVKAALGGSAKTDITALTAIAPGAKGSKAWLAAHILLLSKQAKGLAIPSLEILENDIKAGHATTVGQPSELEMFYLMSRGLPRPLAKRLIVQGFLQDIISELSPELAEQAAREFAA